VSIRKRIDRLERTLPPFADAPASYAAERVERFSEAELDAEIEAEIERLGLTPEQVAEQVEDLQRNTARRREEGQP